ncbi:MAG: GNAT family N-acetyltransferase [Myxococcales bacterium]|nr:GNAT family N-acetyltransferase [Myxococcales bacterium]
MTDPVSQNLGTPWSFARIAAHLVTLAPGERSSEPHAESLEEEVVIVLEGIVHAWIDGWIYPLGPGHAVGFPAGTGVGHSFLNESASPVRLLVFGERTKPDNRCAWPLRLAAGLGPTPDQAAIWWADPPRRPLGPHDGIPGHLTTSDLRQGPWPECIVFCSAFGEPPESSAAIVPETRRSGHYPGDDERFADGLRITGPLQLRALGIWVDLLLPGYRTSWPHAHTDEEELVYVARGAADVWLDGHVRPIAAGESVGFTPGTGAAHTLINDGSEPAIIITVGETADFPGERIVYPKHPLRNAGCARKNTLWLDTLDRPLGNHDGRPRQLREQFRPGHLRLEWLTGDDAADRLLDVFAKSPDYLSRTSRDPTPTRAHAEAALARPPKAALHPDAVKECFLVELEGQAIGVVDLLHGYPAEKTSYLGLLLLNPDRRGQGLARRTMALVTDYCRRAHAATTLRLGVLRAGSEAEVAALIAFWAHLGFSRVAEASDASVDVFEKPVEP